MLEFQNIERGLFLTELYSGFLTTNGLESCPYNKLLKVKDA